MKRSTRILAPIVALVVALGGIAGVSALAQGDPQPVAPLGTYCPPLPANAIAGQDIVCKVIADPFWTPPTTTTTTTSSTTTTVPTTTTTPVTTTTSTTTVAPTTTTTAPPAGVRKGWELTADNVGLKPHGLSCESLKPYDGSAKPAAGTTISMRRVEVPLDLSNGNILIEKSCIKPNRVGGHNEYLVTTTTCGQVCSATAAGNVVIRDSEITAEHLPLTREVAASDGFLGVGKLYRNYIHGMGTGISFFETGTVHDAVAENNFVERLRSYGDSHNEGATVRDFRKNTANTRTVKFIGNRLKVDSGNVTAGLFVQPTWVSIFNLTVQDNLIEGQGYNLYVEKGVDNGTYGNISAVNNRFNPYGGWGPSAVTFGPGWTPWSGNYRYCSNCVDGRGQAVNP